MKRTICFLSFGPYEYDDENTYQSTGHPFEGETQKVCITDGQFKILSPPTENGNLIRFEDLEEMVFLAGGGFPRYIIASGKNVNVPAYAQYVIHSRPITIDGTLTLQQGADLILT